MKTLYIFTELKRQNARHVTEWINCCTCRVGWCSLCVATCAIQSSSALAALVYTLFPLESDHFSDFVLVALFNALTRRSAQRDARTWKLRQRSARAQTLDVITRERKENPRRAALPHKQAESVKWFSLQIIRPRARLCWWLVLMALRRGQRDCARKETNSKK